MKSMCFRREFSLVVVLVVLLWHIPISERSGYNPLNHSREQRDAIAKFVAYGFRLTASSGTPDIPSAT